MRLYVQEINNVNVIQFEEHVSDDKYGQNWNSRKTHESNMSITQVTWYIYDHIANYFSYVNEFLRDIYDRQHN